MRPYRYETAPDRNGDLRQVIVFRLLSTTTDEQEPYQAAALPTKPGSEPPAAPAGDREISFVDSENNTVTENETAPRTGAVARRQEALLVQRFETWLHSQGHVTNGFGSRSRASRARS